MSNKLIVGVLEALFLGLFWAWVLCAVLFLRNIILLRLPIPQPDEIPIPVHSVRFQATDGTWLAGWTALTDPQQPWIILCHGLGTDRTDLLEIAQVLFDARYNLLMFDFRGHGESQGRVTSFGWREQQDLQGALAFLGRLPEASERPYGVYGVSMGGAVALMVAARDERLQAVVVDSIYADLETALAHHLKLLYRLPRVPFLACVNLTYRLRFGTWPSRMSPLRTIDRISPRAVFIIHGDADPRMPLEQARALYAQAGHPKSLWVVQGAVHLGAMAREPEAYVRRVLGFFQSYL